MELQIKEYQLPDRIEFNFEQIKAELMEKAEAYSTVVYDEEHIKQAKADRASLNKLKDALNNERIRREKEYMRPFSEFKEQINEIIKIIDKPIAEIDKQIKAAEEDRKVTKREEIGQLWFEIPHPDWLTLPQIFNEKWLNASVRMSNVKDDLEGIVNKVNAEMETLASLPDYSFEAQEEYKRTLDINVAISVGRRMAEIQQKKAETINVSSEAEKPLKSPQSVSQEHSENEDEPPRWWITFKAYMSMDEATNLKKFFEMFDIQYEPVKEVAQK